MKIGDYSTHPAADAFPLMVGDEYERLVADLKTNNLRCKITLHKGTELLLDGRNRLRGCIDAGIKPAFEYYDGEPLAFIVTANIVRRHLNESQRALVAAKLASLPQGGDRRSRGSGRAAACKQSDAAKLLNVGERTVRDARAVLDHAEPELVQAVERGDLRVTAAAELAKQPAGKQRDAANKARSQSGAELIRNVKARDRDAKTANPQRVLLEVMQRMVRQLEQFGATVDRYAVGIVPELRIAFCGRTFTIRVTETTAAAAAWLASMTVVNHG